MKILVVDAWLPTPDRDSASLRMVNLLRILCEFGEVTFAADDFAARRSGLDKVQSLGVSVVVPPEPAQGHLERCGQAYQVIFLSREPVAEKYVTRARKTAPKARLVFDTTDLHYVRAFRGAKVTGKLNLLRQAMETKQAELAVMRQADATLVVSTVERDILENDCPEARVHIVSNIHEVSGAGRPFAQRAGIVFVGAFAHHPNQDAVEFFCRDILPRVRETLANAPITIIGRQPPNWLRAMNGEHFHVMEHVRDLAPILDACRLTIAPLRYGAGVKGKVLTSMSYGVPVTATSVAAEGIPVVNWRDMLIADEPGSFAGAVDELYRDEKLWNTISENGRAIVARYFSPEVAREALAELFEQLGLQ